MMGFSFKKIFSKRGLQSFLGTGGMLPGVDIAITQDAGNKIYEDVHKGLGNLVTGGYLAQKDATEEAKKARDQAASQYQAEIDAAAETARKVAETEEERKRRLAAMGTQTPSTLTGSYLGIPGRVNQSRSLLG
jgi:hypothetical protein